MNGQGVDMRRKTRRPPSPTAEPALGTRSESPMPAPSVSREQQAQLQSMTPDLSPLGPSVAGKHQVQTPAAPLVRADLPAAVLLTIDEAAAALRVTRSWLRDRVSARIVPHTRLGRHVRFTPAHLAQIIASGEEPSGSTPVPTVGSHRRRSPSC